MGPAKILVVEDNPADVHVLRRSLDEIGEDYVLEVLYDGERALEFIHDQRKNRHDAQPCVILLDLHLPKHNGLQVLHAIREEPVLSHVKVVLMTGLASPQEQAELTRMEADWRLKPGSLSEFSDLAAYLIALCRGIHATI
jgi:CheY-like chemotaxis protein